MLGRHMGEEVGAMKSYQKKGEAQRKGFKNEISLSGRMQGRICNWEIKDIGRCELTNTTS